MQDIPDPSLIDWWAQIPPVATLPEDDEEYASTPETPVAIPDGGEPDSARSPYIENLPSIEVNTTPTSAPSYPPVPPPKPLMPTSAPPR